MRTQQSNKFLIIMMIGNKPGKNQYIVSHKVL